MFWTIFTIVDLYVGLVVLKTMESSLPPEKLPRVKIVQKAIWVLLGLSCVWLVLKLLHQV